MRRYPGGKGGQEDLQPQSPARSREDRAPDRNPQGGDGKDFDPQRDCSFVQEIPDISAQYLMSKQLIV